MNMPGATMNPTAGGPVGGGMMIINNAATNANNAIGSPALMNKDEKSPDVHVILNTYIYEYILRLRHFEIARALKNEENFKMRTQNRKDAEVNGVEGDSMDMDGKDDIPDDLPFPVGANSGAQGHGFLYEWFSVFSDLFAAHTGRHKGVNPTPATQYLNQHQLNQRLRENQQNQGLARSGMMVNPNFMRNGQMRNGMVNGDMANKKLTPQQMSMLQNHKAMQQQQQQMARGEQPDGDPNARPATPGDGDNGGSPPKRPRLEGGQQFPAGMMPNGRPGVPGAAQQSMMIQAGFMPGVPQAQFRQGGGMPSKGMTANMANGMMNMQNAGSPMMQPIGNFPDNVTMEMYNGNRMAGQAIQGGANGQSGNHALQDYQMQLMLLEQQNKKRLMMARQEQHDSGNPRDGQPMPGGVGMQPGMSPPGSRSGASPNPADQMKRTPQVGGMPGSPAGGEMQGRSPAPMGFMNGMQHGDFNPTMFLKDGPAMMGPGGPGVRPPTSVDMMNRQQAAQAAQQAQQQAAQQQVQQQGPGRMPFPGGQPMQQQPSQGQPQPVGTPGQREMPPPSAIPANNNAQRNNQPASPANSNNAPPTPSTGNKPNPKKKATGKEQPKRSTKKGSTANASNGEENPPATPTGNTPITPNHQNTFNGSGGKGPAQGGQNNQQAQANVGMPPNQQPMAGNDLGQNNNFPDFSGPTQEPFHLDFSTLENSDVLENFDFDSFLNTSNEDGPFNFVDGPMVDNFPMDPNET